MNKYLQIIHGTDIYKDLELLPKFGNENGDILSETMDKIFGFYNEPEVTIIEVGTFFGASITRVAKYFLKKNIKPLIFCIDTWTGDTFMRGQKQWMDWLKCKNGYPTIYYQFLSNIIHENLQEYVIPVPHTSSDAYRYLEKLNISADFCYIDGCHFFEEVSFDIENYYKLIKKGGILFGDDYDSGWLGVVNAVNSFVRQNKFDYEISNSKWILRKK